MENNKGLSLLSKSNLLDYLITKNGKDKDKPIIKNYINNQDFKQIRNTKNLIYSTEYLISEFLSVTQINTICSIESKLRQIKREIKFIIENYEDDEYLDYLFECLGKILRCYIIFLNLLMNKFYSNYKNQENLILNHIIDITLFCLDNRDLFEKSEHGIYTDIFEELYSIAIITSIDSKFYFCSALNHSYSYFFKDSKIIKYSLTLLRLYFEANYYKLFKLLRNNTFPLINALFSYYLPSLRIEYLKQIQKIGNINISAYKLTLDKFNQLFMFNNDQEELNVFLSLYTNIDLNNKTLEILELNYVNNKTSVQYNDKNYDVSINTWSNELYNRLRKLVN